MKTKGLFISLLLLATQSFSQTNNCDELKKQNQALQDKLKQYGIDINNNATTVESYSSDITVNFIKCVGDSKQQTVTLYFNVINPNLPNQKFYLNGCNNSSARTQAFDEIGNGYVPNTATLGAVKADESFSRCYTFTGISTKLTTGNLPVMGSITFINVLPTVKNFELIDICMNNFDLIGNANQEANRGITEIKNVKIDWK